ncbi:hypothetical protein [Mycolicibacterium palauense]|uniref:hypothetical protein n=1 Tax=Mycolicibacterium palauense TaxID=2034511 RepID=UPI000BFEF5DE|nr:hypothetical protein [Mycolicibacterium palauense]
MNDRASLDEVLLPEYGRFNPRFLGLTFLFDCPDDYNVVRAAMTGPGGLRSPKAAETGLHEIALLSVFDHEYRHYLDFLLSPYSTTVFRMRLQALINGSQALSAARDLPGDVLPLPLTRWAILPEAERRSHEGDWSQLFGRQVGAVQLPSRSKSDLLTNLAAGVTSIGHRLTQDQFEAHTDAAVRAYLRISQLTEGFDVPAVLSHLRPPYVHEASALSAQLAAILVAQGELEFSRFANLLMNSTAPQARAWQTCYTLARQLSADEDSVSVVRRIPSITTWALFGNLEMDGAAGCPTSRLSRLMVAVDATPEDPRWRCDMDDPSSIDRMWSHWDETTGLRPWAESLARHADVTRRSIDQYENVRAAWAGDPEMVDAVIAVLRQLIGHQGIALSTLTEDLRQIVDPFRYVQISEPTMLLPDIRFEFRGFGMDPAGARAGRWTHRRSASGDEITTGVALSGGPSGGEEGDTLLDQKLMLEQMMEWCDLAFSDLPVPDHIHTSARRGIEDLTGKRTVQLF